ncbi:DUF86 domain-containing protein [Patescibacteria group bacterium]|nr:DUF86 domain-containing protein [Patescibacteria group bacterium]MBU4368786.1 DUF86 domain-containing protein [Patescibacteria group bacterium]
MPKENKKIELLKKYFSKRKDVLMAFIFGSRAKKRSTQISDWDIAAYFESPYAGGIEIENNRDYPCESEIWGDLVKILGTDNVDFIILNRAPASIAAAAIAQGLPLVIKDRKIYLEFMLAATMEAEDYRKTAKEYAQVYWRSRSLSEEDKHILNQRLIFLDSELSDTDKFKPLTRLEYEQDHMKRRQVERWIENLINAAIDISKTILASQKRPIPSTYREILKGIDAIVGFPEGAGEQLAKWTELRNILAHEYLDIRWKRIDDFIKRSEPYFRKLIEAVKSNFLSEKKIGGKRKMRAVFNLQRR